MKKKKILIIDLGNEYGGAEKVIENISNMLKVDMEVFLYINEKNYDKMKEATKNIAIFKTNTSKSKYISIIKQIVSIIRNEDIDTINTHGMLANLVGIIVKKICGIKWVTTIHSDIYYDFSIKKAKIYSLLENITIKFADEIITVSKDLGNKIYSRYGKKTKVIHNGIDESIDNVCIEKDLQKLSILFVGRLSKVKNVELLLLGLKGLKEKKISFECNIVGDGEEKQNLEGLVKQYKIDDEVTFRGFSNDIYRYMKKSNILAITSHMEGIPIVIIEAFMNRIPVIASNVGGITEMIQDNKTGILFDKNNSEEFINCIYDISQGKYNLDMLAEQAYLEYRENWSIDKMKKSYLEVL